MRADLPTKANTEPPDLWATMVSTLGGEQVPALSATRPCRRVFRIAGPSEDRELALNRKPRPVLKERPRLKPGTSDWSEFAKALMVAAQAVPACSVGGRIFPRLRFGTEFRAYPRDLCFDCGVMRGQLHTLTCQEERCPVCGVGRVGDRCCGDVLRVLTPGRHGRDERKP